MKQQCDYQDEVIVLRKHGQWQVVQVVGGSLIRLRTQAALNVAKLPVRADSSGATVTSVARSIKPTNQGASDVTHASSPGFQRQRPL